MRATTLDEVSAILVAVVLGFPCEVCARIGTHRRKSSLKVIHPQCDEQYEVAADACFAISAELPCACSDPQRRNQADCLMMKRPLQCVGLLVG